MSEKKNIDRLFQERLKDFEVTPNEPVWDKISAQLGHKRKRKFVPIWWRIGGMAAALVLLFTIGYSIFSNNETTELPVVSTDSTTTPSIKENPENEVSIKENMNIVVGSEDENIVQNKSNALKPSNNLSRAGQSTTLSANTTKKSSISISSNNRESITLNTDQTTIDSPQSSEIEKVANNKEQSKSLVGDEIKIATSENPSPNKEPLKTDEILEEKFTLNNSIENAIAEANNINEEENEKLNRWSISPNVAPVYFNSLGNGSSIGSQFNNNSAGGDINMSYGIKGTYAISDKLKIRTGLNKVNLNYSTQDIIVYTGADVSARGITGNEGNIKFKEGIQGITLLSRTIINSDSAPEIVNTTYNGNLDQQFGYIEIPLELEYTLVNKVLSVNVIGGFSTLFLNNNEIYADLEGTNTLIGESENINNTSYTANFGLGLSYGVTEQLNLNLEPTFKYQINGFNNTTGDFQPFFVGVYTGLSFKF